MIRSPFISLDGLDGAGKSTQCRLLADWLRTRGWTVVECADPGGTEIGQVLRNLLLEHRGQMSLPCEALLFMASRAQLTAEIIRPALEKGQAVVCDRFLLANVVYQGHAGGLDPQLLWSVGLMATGGLEPELTFVLDLPTEFARSRRKTFADRMESRATDFHERVRTGFRKEAERRPDRIVLLDATLLVNDVQEQMRREMLERTALTPKPADERSESAG
ncbi:MAG: dTMP kinase [Planctomycetes bacterium]|nr:dTMP kinase [Planctomycetota bacterium]